MSKIAEALKDILAQRLADHGVPWINSVHANNVAKTFGAPSKHIGLAYGESMEMSKKNWHSLSVVQKNTIYTRMEE